MAIDLLIVDDSPAMRSFITRVIELTGLDVGTCLHAGNGEEALEVLARQTVDVVLTDINMPGMNGEEFVSRMAASETLRHIPIMVVSTDSTLCRHERMTSLGVRGYLRKPFTPEALRLELVRVLSVQPEGSPQ
ncbi:MAG: response regulator [Bryobacteraceae bacterium]